MKADIRTLIRDIQAAARIGHTESLWAALDRLLELPQIAGNHPMNEAFLNQVVLPVGKAVGRSRVTYAALQPLVSHPFAAFRAVAGAALLGQYLEGRNGTTLNAINTLVQDPRKDVREAIRLAAIRANYGNPVRLEELYQAWLGSDSPRVQALAYQILPNLPDELVLQHLESLETSALTDKTEVKTTLASTLSSLAANGQPGKVLEILASWASQPEPDHRMVARCLSNSWAAKYPDESLQILADLAARTGPKKRIRKALESLYRHGAQEQVLAALQNWLSSENANLRAAGRDERLAF